MDDDFLIELVHQHGELYDTAHRKYTDNHLKERIWQIIGKRMEKSSSECKSRWISLRDQFRKALKKKPGNGVTSSKRKKWKFEDSMSFMIPFFKERDALGNLELPCSGDSDDGDMDGVGIIVEGSNPHKKRKLETLQPKESSEPSRSLENGESRPAHKKKGEPEDTALSVLVKYLLQNNEKDAASTSVDPTDMFFTSIATTVKQFSPLRQNLAKSRVFSVISQLEVEEIQGKTCPERTAKGLPSPSLGQYQRQQIKDLNSEKDASSYKRNGIGKLKKPPDKSRQLASPSKNPEQLQVALDPNVCSMVQNNSPDDFATNSTDLFEEELVIDTSIVKSEPLDVDDEFPMN